MIAPRKKLALTIVGGIDFAPPSETADQLSATAENRRLRQQRDEVWQNAATATNYWRLRLDFHSAVALAQSREIPEGRFHPVVNRGERMPIVDKWRATFVSQLLTPAPDVAAVNWKKRALVGRQLTCTDVKPEQIERAIADDLAFLAAHPVRRSNSEAMAHRREFKDAMRQRIRDIAASRDLSDEEIKPVLKLKHHEIARFTETHGVNLGWLLEGKGRIFKKDLIRLSPNMTEDEFAAVVTTMPIADQQAIRATLREMLQERDQ